VSIQYFRLRMKAEVKTYSRPENAPSIRLLMALNIVLARLYHRVKILTPCPLPPKGPAILVCNHLSSLDPVLIQSATGRLIRWMMAREYYEQKALKPIFDTIGIIPVERNKRDIAATRAALEALSSGYVLGIFPEGKIETENMLLSFQSGISLLAAKSGAPIYPAYLEGTQRSKEMLSAFLFPRRSTLGFGPPLNLARAEIEKIGFEGAAAKIREGVDLLRLADIEYRKEQLK